ncbi:piggyBac transposable element-derived protein 4-like [Parambassis ranga]|uniref:PiggyBac transposable element-derived protein 4-like n=1 Tax=Parambassis ranga TaxID=210632 RepID=A0A6P7JRE7_9TELE|nr:piggyBac transposable element-derived protein 4-like [Parambassis ranga]
MEDSTEHHSVEVILDDSDSGAVSLLSDEEWELLLDSSTDSEIEDNGPGRSSTLNGRPSSTPTSALPTRSSSKRPLTSSTTSTPRRWKIKRRSRSTSRSRSPADPKPAAQPTRWNSTEVTDTGCSHKKFTPSRKPGHQLNSHGSYTPFDLFSLFLDRSAVSVLCNNTNKQAAKNIAKGKKYTWTRLGASEFYKFLGLTFYFSLVKISAIVDYWKTNSIFSLPFPPKIMSRDRYRTISWNVHMSDPDKDVDNDKKKGTPEYDKLFRVRPLLDTLTTACKSCYHPRQNISVDERMVAHTGMTQYMRDKPTKWGFKLFVLADSSNGYTVDFSLYMGKSKFSSGGGLAYDTVMSLVNPSFLGGGYHLYVDNFYTSPKLFRDLYKKNIGACGTFRDRYCPPTKSNALKNKDPRGTIRWLRDGPLVFVKWKDSRQVGICSTIHPAFKGETVDRHYKDANGKWAAHSLPCPNPIIEYNKYMGGVDLSDQLIQYYSVHHTTMRWYRTMFYHFLDIAATNAYILHKELCKEKKRAPGTHREFLQELTAQLCGVSMAVPPAKAPEQHLPVAVSEQTDVSKRASYGRRTCVHCRHTIQKLQSTPWKCQVCEVALCLIADRNCFQKWHQEHKQQQKQGEQELQQEQQQ